MYILQAQKYRDLRAFPIKSFMQHCNTLKYDLAIMKEEDDHATVASRNPSHRFERPLKFKRPSGDTVADSSSIISDLPDAVLQHILSYIPTKLAITTSVLSKRWRHVWTETPHLSFEWLNVTPKVINKTLARYSASKITSFRFYTSYDSRNAYHVNKSIEFAMSHNVESLSLENSRDSFYNFPDFFYTNNSSMKRVHLKKFDLIPKCIVSWTSLRNLSLKWCELSDESFLKVLSGCPILETLTLHLCLSLKYLDLSKSLRLRRLEIERRPCHRAPFQSMQIVAPHIHYLRLRDCEAHCTFVDVSSLIEADVEVRYFHPRTYFHDFELLDPNDLLLMVQKLIEAFQNVEKLTLGVYLLQMLSLSNIPTSLPLPMLKVNNLTLEIRIMRSVVRGIERLLQNSPGLNKLTVYDTTAKCYTQLCDCVDSYLDKQCWRLEDKVFPTSWDEDNKVVKPKVVGSFMEHLLANTKTLETLVVHLSRNCISRTTFEELSQIALTLSYNNNVSILLKRTGG